MDSTCATRSASTCAYCSAATSRGKYCSERCKNRTAWERRKKAPCSICGAATGWAASDPRSEGARCRECTKSPCGTTAAYGRGCRCTECRAASAEAMREYVARLREAGMPSSAQKARPRRSAGVHCVRCGVELQTLRRLRACKECSQHVRNARNAAQARRKRAERALAQAAKGTSGGFVWMQGHCPRCGDYFIRRASSTPYCSGRCSRKARDERWYKKWISARDRRAIYERDNWTCQLCFEPVDRTAHYLDDWAPSLDHIEPRSQALIPDHSAENLRCAHRWCNAVRGDGTYHADLFAVA